MLRAVSRGANGKASGPDRLTNECLKDALGVLLLPLTNLFNFCFSHGCCPPQWCHSYLLTLYKGKGSKSDPNSARGIALQSRLLNIYCYLLDQRLYHWAEAQSLIPREQYGFRSGKSTMSAIADLSAWVKDSLSKPKCPLYTSLICCQTQQPRIRDSFGVFRVQKSIGRTETGTRDRVCFQSIRTVRDISRYYRARIGTPPYRMIVY